MTAATCVGTCFVHVRCFGVKNTTQFEGTVLQRVLDDQVSSLQTFDVLKCNYGLSERRVWSMVNGHPASMADSIKWQGVGNPR